MIVFVTKKPTHIIKAKTSIDNDVFSAIKFSKNY